MNHLAATPVKQPMINTWARSLIHLAAAAGALLGSHLAHADNHALIMWIGSYADPQANLPGIEQDAANARKIALAMGVPSSNITEISNQSLTQSQIAKAMEDLARRIGKDDKVFLYYSGHGAQVEGQDGSKCTEGIVSHDMRLYDDARMQSALAVLGAKASQVVMMNDSCFSGGAASKGGARSVDDAVAKFYPGTLKAGATVSEDHTCGTAVNKMARNLVSVASSSPRPPQVLYIAASAADEVSYATSRGSVATLAWASCLTKGDANLSGTISGEELRACAQSQIPARSGRGQTITLLGNASLPLMFSTQPDTTAVDAVGTLEDIRAMRDPKMQLGLTVAKRKVRIDQDWLEFSVSSNTSGYLYILHVGSDGKTFDLLFPNQQDSNNFIREGNHQFPRASWRIRAAGPTGKDHLLAVLSNTRKNFDKGMDVSSMFPSSATTMAGAKNLQSEASGSGRIGASDVVSVEEIN